MGLRSLEDGYVPPILDVSKLDRKLLVSNAESVAAVRALLDREGIFARRLGRRRRPRRAAHRRRAARGLDRRRGARRRRLEVPLGRLLAAPTTSRSRWRRRSGGSPGRDPRRARRARRGGGAERVLRPDPLQRRRRRRALHPRPQPPRVAVPLRARDRPRGVVPRGRAATSWPSSTRTPRRSRSRRRPTRSSRASGAARRS